ncbi:hypothetical protein GWK47_022317 [Chionoecetes opilio]|uniref:Uncharacterized protein n=1 Tax=Chionoecetes opilio TaxID=41210 RepID=A0A8J5CFW8_CHIOP|nr:hypothetical protein GWK47_022317 [Chionoecetes opilio]
MAKGTGRPEKTKEQTPDKAHAREREAEKSEDKAKVKKTPSSESDKPKSMYKMLTSRFNRSASFVSDTSRSAAATTAEDEEGGEKEDKFRLKRPSRFLKPRTEKSASKTSVCDTDDDTDKPDKKPSKKLTDALNKFLGRKDSTKMEARPAGPVSTKAALPCKAPTDDNHPKKPPRARDKMCEENLSTIQTEKDGGREHTQRTVPEAVSASDSSTTTATTTTTQPNYTLESATKSICNHLSQLENDITSRIGNMGTQDQRGGGRVQPAGSGGGRRVAAAAAAGQNISNYGLSPALANRRNGRPTNLDAAMGNMEGGQHATRAPSAPPPGRTAAARPTADASDKIKVQDPQAAGSPSPPPAEGMSEAEDESVMDRIMRKSYYSKFQEKKRPRLWRANTREDMDQQLAAAKARLLKEEREETSHGARRLSSPRSLSSWDHDRPASRTSLPPDDATTLIQQGGWRSSSLQPDHLLAPLLPVVPGEPAPYSRPPSLSPEDRFFYPRAPSVPRDEYLSRGARMQSNPAEDLLAGQYSRRPSSVAPEDSSVQSVGAPYGHNTMTAPMAAGSLAGQVTADRTLQRGEMGSHEQSEGCMQSPEPTSMEESRSQAREELSRRLTHLTRLSGGSGLSGWSRWRTTKRRRAAALPPYQHHRPPDRRDNGATSLPPYQHHGPASCRCPRPPRQRVPSSHAAGPNTPLLCCQNLLVVICIHTRAHTPSMWLSWLGRPASFCGSAYAPGLYFLLCLWLKFCFYREGVQARYQPIYVRELALLLTVARDAEPL